MATLEQLAADYARRLNNSLTPSEEARRIASDINSLTRSGTGDALSLPEKTHLADLILEALRAPRVAEVGGTVGILKEADNKKYLQLVQQLKLLLKD